MWILTTTKKLKEKFRNIYYDGIRIGVIHAQVHKKELQYVSVVANVTAELNELEKNTWDKERVARIKKLLMMSLS